MSSDKDSEPRTPLHDALQLYFLEHGQEILQSFPVSSLESLAWRITATKSKTVPLQASPEEDVVQSYVEFLQSEVPLKDNYERLCYLDFLTRIRISHHSSKFAVDFGRFGSWRLTCAEHPAESLAIIMSEINSQTVSELSEISDAKTIIEHLTIKVLPRLHPETALHFFTFLVAIEVKPKIYSFGETLRQCHEYTRRLNLRIKTKQDSCNRTLMFLFTPDTRFDNQFESQGVHAIHPDMSKVREFASKCGIDFPGEM